MKFLHTADWHLGVKTNGRDRLGEQKKVLDEILSIANYENVDCVIVAGDVFNTSNPTAEAEELFFETVEKLSAGGDRFVLVVAGNHDDPTRLTAGLPLATKHNIAMVGGLEKLNERMFPKGTLVEVVETGKGYIKIQKNVETVCLAYLPYPSESRINEKVDSELSLDEKVKIWAQVGGGAFSESTFNVFVSHLFLVGGAVDGGKVKVGDILAVSKSSLPKADYTALGHLHTPQEFPGKVFYSGSITELSPKQKGLSVSIFESESGKLVDQHTVPLQNTAKYEKVVVGSIEEAESKLSAYDDSDIVELEIRQTAPLSATELKALRKDFACISNISLMLKSGAESTENESRKHLSDEELFRQFYYDAKGFEPSDALVKMFLLCKGEEDETD